MTDLCATVLTLTPARVGAMPAHQQGRAAHALFLRLVGGADPALAARLHEDAQVKPFTCSSPWRSPPPDGRGPGGGGKTELGETWHLRYTTLTAELTAVWTEGVLPSLPDEVVLDEMPFTVHGAASTAEAHPAAGRATYAGLASSHMLASATAPASWRFAFRSPTAFHSGGMTVPIPLPDLLFGSLLDRWNAWSPVALNPEVRRFARECIAVSRYRLQTRPVPGKGGRVERGAVGGCTYVALNRDRYWCSTIGVLAAFATYGGAGYGTAQGMGACAWVP